MPYLILVLGIVAAVAGFYRYILRASPREVKTLFLAIAAAGVGLAAFVLAVTGKLPAAIAILAALWPIAAAWLRNRPVQAPASGGALPLTRDEAFDVLGLPPTASEGDIRAAHLRLMKKLHPDQAGSGWLAQKINAARDILLKQ